MHPTARRKPKSKTYTIEGNQVFPGGHAETVGKRQSMEDTCLISGEFAGPKTQFYGVFDGHGGNNTSLFLLENFIPTFLSFYQNGTTPVNNALLMTFEKLDKDSTQFPASGSTAAVVLIIDDILYAANVGDSRVVIQDGDKIQRLSYDHRISDPSEASRVKARGGIIVNNRVGGLLNLSRSIGDVSCRSFIDAEPYMIQVPRKDGMKLILACDGVWDVLTDDQAFEIFNHSSSPGNAAKTIEEQALEHGSTDNITVVCAILTPK